MLKKGRETSSLPCKIIPPPKGCEGLFPNPGNECKEPIIQLDRIGSISCDGVISGRVLCDFRPVAGVAVTLSATPPIVNFADSTPITDETGRFSTVVSVPRGTPITSGVVVTAAAVVAGQSVSDSISVTVDCIVCTNPILTLNPIEGPVGCEGAPLSGRLICDGNAIARAPITFTITSQSKRVVVNPNPAITQNDGTYSATVVPFIGINETITIVASTRIGGIEVVSEARQLTVRCVKCVNPVIFIKKVSTINCDGVISGTVLCDGVPIPNVPVTLSGPPFLQFEPEVPITDVNGVFTSRVTVSSGTLFQEAEITASAVVSGIEVSTSRIITAGCLFCRNPELTLNTPKKVIGCEGAELTGKLTCGGIPFPGASIAFILTPQEGVTIVPDPAVTGEDGSYRARIVPELGTVGTFTIEARTVIAGVLISSEVKTIRVDCECKNPVISIDDPGKINCESPITGRLTCEGFPLAGVEVTFSSPLLAFDPNPVVTDENGEFSTTATVPFGTEPQETTLTATGGGATETITVKVFCKKCRNPLLTLKAPKFIGCDGGKVTGRLTCDGVPLKGNLVTFTTSPAGAIAVSPNPVTTDEDGRFTAVLTTTLGVEEVVTIQASSIVSGTVVVSENEKIKVKCVCKHPEIILEDPCKINCEGEIRGKVKCEGLPLAGVEVMLSSPILDFDPNPVLTDETGSFSAEVTVPSNTPLTETTITARVTVNGKTITETIKVKVICLKCRNPKLTLNTPKYIGCPAERISGRLTCDGVPVRDAAITFVVTSDTPGAVTVDPNPAFTNDMGEYTASIRAGAGVTEVITIRAEAVVSREGVSSESQQIKVDCQCEDPRLELECVKKIRCRAEIKGRFLCKGEPLAGVKVTLTSPLLDFEPAEVYTNQDGYFRTSAVVPGERPYELTTYTARVEIGSRMISQTCKTVVGCERCKNPRLTLCTPLFVGCEGEEITGEVLCDHRPVEGVNVYFKVVSSHGEEYILSNPAVTKADGTYTARIVPAKGKVDIITITATAEVGDEQLKKGPFLVVVKCPCPPHEGKE
ncbi:hypothetical protein VL03_07755 [Rossellomorea marisflavi]|nr:hypothetical protein VL03_07755 [Rossellomorea marisflavi]